MKMPREFIQKITAPNGSIFTGSGTNSYIIGKNDLTLVDPGPKIDSHIEKLVDLGDGKINRILVICGKISFENGNWRLPASKSSGLFIASTYSVSLLG